MGTTSEQTTYDQGYQDKIVQVLQEHPGITQLEIFTRTLHYQQLQGKVLYYSIDLRSIELDYKKKKISLNEAKKRKIKLLEQVLSESETQYQQYQENQQKHRRAPKGPAQGRKQAKRKERFDELEAVDMPSTERWVTETIKADAFGEMAGLRNAASMAVTGVNIKDIGLGGIQVGMLKYSKDLFKDSMMSGLERYKELFGTRGYLSAVNPFLGLGIQTPATVTQRHIPDKLQEQLEDLYQALHHRHQTYPSVVWSRMPLEQQAKEKHERQVETRRKTVERALKKLLAAGKITKTGERIHATYRLADAPPTGEATT